MQRWMVGAVGVAFSWSAFVPIALILMGLLEMNGVSDGTLYAFGGVLVAARLSHALGLKQDEPTNVLRGLGAGATALLTVVMSVWGIVLAA